MNKEISHVFEIVEKLIFFAENNFTKRLSERERDNELTIVAGFLFRKNIKTLKSIYELCKKNLGHDSLILSRALYESCLCFAYIVEPLNYKNEDIMHNRAHLFVHYESKERENTRNNYDKLKNKGKCPEWVKSIDEGLKEKDSKEDVDGFKKSLEYYGSFLDEDIKYLKTRFSNYKKNNNKNLPKTWNSLSVLKTAEFTDERYECYYHMIYNYLSAYVHSSPRNANIFYSKNEDFGVLQSLSFASENFLHFLYKINNSLEMGIDIDKDLKELKIK